MEKWITAWTQAHTNAGMLCGKAKNHTVRATVIGFVSGSKIRIGMSNRDGEKSLHVLKMSVQTPSSTLYTVRFHGKEELILQPGEKTFSDILDVPVTAGEEFCVTMAFNGTATSGNQLPASVQYSKPGNYVGESQMPLAKKELREIIMNMTPVIPGLADIDVCTQDDKRIIVCFGDSITQQGHWTNPLADMMHYSGENAVILNKGISGNCVLPGVKSVAVKLFGKPATERFQEDVLAVEGATDVIIAMGINDIGNATNQKVIERFNADKLMIALKDMTQQAKKAGLRVYVATLTPRIGYSKFHDFQETERMKFNQMVRSYTELDGVLDFDAVCRDEKETGLLAQCSDSGDHLHPSPTGGRKMAREAFVKLTRKI